MDGNLNCCLCFSSCTAFKIIQDDRGESTEFYNVTVKYFDPMILGEDQGDTSMDTLTRVLCGVCWEHIHSFHEFQQSVLKARTLLQEMKYQKINGFSLEQMTDVGNGYKEHPSVEDLPEEKPEDFISDFNEDVPLQTLFRQTRLRNRAKNKQQKSTSDPENSIFRNSTDNTGQNDVNETKASDIFPVKFEKEPSIDLEQFSSVGLVEQEEVDQSNDLEVKVEEVELTQTECEETTSPLVTTRRQKRTKIESKSKPSKVKQDEEKQASRDKIKEKRKQDDLFIAQWKPILDCDLCSATVSNFDEMRDHFAEDHKTRYYIKCCERKFYRRYALITHIRLHVNPETYKCDICGRRSTTKHNLHLHKKIVHSQSKEFECDVCHKLFNQKPNLERHLLIHVEGEKQFFCKECGRGYVLEVQLKSHIKSVHEVNNICDQCGKICHGQGALKTHMMEHSGIKRRRHPCDICGIEIVSKIGLKRHKAAFHHDGSTAYVCGVCGKVTSSENALMHHKKYVHEKIKKHKCTYCDKAFMKPKGLREHIATHTGVDLYQCPHCPQTFKVSANMHHHRKRAHPVEWAEARKFKVILPKVNLEQCTNHVVL